MKFKTISSDDQEVVKFIKPAELTELTGTLEDIRPNEKYGPTYMIRDKDGDLFGVNGCKALNDTLGSKVEIGTRVQLKGHGKIKTKNGNDFVKVEVAVEEEE